MKQKKFKLVDNCSGHVFCEGDNYNSMAYTFFHIVDHVYAGDEQGYLHLVDNETGRSMSVVCKNYP